MKSIRKSARGCRGPLCILLFSLSFQAGCGGSGAGAGNAVLSASRPNVPPVIGGDPPASVVAGDAYSFTPAVSDADSSTLFFGVDGLPGWAIFSDDDGTISGTPGVADVGVYGAVVITVSDGSGSDSLGPFDIEVVAPGAPSGAVELSWTRPTTNVDGSELNDLAGYRIYWGQPAGDFPNSVTIDNPTVDRYRVEGLVPGTWEFAATALNAAGVESRFSDVVSAVVD